MHNFSYFSTIAKRALFQAFINETSTGLTYTFVGLQGHVLVFSTFLMAETGHKCLLASDPSLVDCALGIYTQVHDTNAF